MPLQRRSLERFAVLVVIVATHVLFLEIFFRNGRQHIRLSAHEERGELFFFELPPPEADEPSALTPEARPAHQAQPPNAGNAITAPNEKPPVTSIDWYGDAGRIARDGLARSLEPKPRVFGEQPKSPYKKPPKRKGGYEWQPEEKRAGFAGPLPYVRLGKRCIIIPPFFGCRLGKLPKSGGATLEEIRDPDRPRDSVPDSRE
jgi:hypothetical protein